MDKAFLLTVIEKPSFGETYLTLDAALVGIAEDGTPRNITGGSLSSYDSDLGLADFHVDAQNSEAHARHRNGQAYSWEYGIKPIGLAGAAQVIAAGKVAQRIEKKLDALASRFGQPTDFGAYLTRVADAIGVTQCVVTRVPGANGSYSAGVFDFLTMAEGAEWLRSKDREFIHKQLLVAGR